ncbi:antitoxin [Arsenicicoccus piscis]|uniref:Antitoxin FitA-like ribbon-helix-helix domain-containing protein n=1 Tax=Arsenicicoccus piscis TaxID=673954 RepID=A0ABQ6HQR4_9MICO|nr:antitoxin [Arsenicicoccus piscis]MCH8627984.1 antitoxin [Arsenicicoccus piscis]GMA20671.1 hypothetical protein GCM10025862_26920 [Arsenicicoccus piscis]
MTTLYIREVPEAVADALKARAAAQGQSLSAYVSAQLAVIAARPTNAEIVARLRARDRSPSVSTERILDEVESARR